MWILFAIAASIAWGLDYSLAERVFEQKISVYTFVIVQLCIVLLFLLISMPFFTNIKPELTRIFGDRQLFLTVFGGALAFTLGNLLICLSIADKNATVAGLIEISYPLFIVFFTWLLFGKNHLSLWTLLGGVLIFSGIFVIYAGEK